MTAQSSPLFSVIIPTHNRCDYLRGAVASVFGQTLSSWELIIIDDGSVDTTSAYVAELPADRVTSIRHEHPQGVSRARNAGIARARGHIVAFLDDDDEYVPEFLAIMADLFSGPTGPDIAWGESAGWGAVPNREPWHNPVSQDLVVCSPPSLAGISASLGLCARRAVLAVEGGFDEYMAVSEDIDLLFRFASAGRIYAHVRRPLVRVRAGNHPSLSRSRDYAKIADSEARLITKHSAFLRRLPDLRTHYLGSLAGAYYRAGRWREARATMSELLRHRPLSPRSWERLLRFESRRAWRQLCGKISQAS
ncbi:glycosyltransferase family 2 protein [Acidiferrobacter sp.]|uniref:glycosyltransferase family 2 protein n=1 Tax=Acidiferrobacter sp. TaxID=1872107 RepID=UPI002602C44A|nr:glycosyltransferase family 2 protein [Acidiferrobacter sp.]